MVARFSGDEQLVEVLLERGARVNVQSKHEKFTPLMVALARSNIKIVKMLLEYGADQSITNHVSC